MSIKLEEQEVKKVISYNSQSNWGIFAVPNKKLVPELEECADIIITGNFEGIYEGCKVNIEANLATHPRYGKQLQLVQYKILEDTSSKESIVNFLTKSSISGIHKKLANKIYDMFGEESIHVVLHDTVKLRRVDGIGEKTYQIIQKSVSQYFAMEELLNFCASIGLSKYALIIQLFKEFGQGAVKMLKENPYQLLLMSESLSFTQIDDIAMKAGIKADDDNRLTFGLLYVLQRESILQGSTGCSDAQLKQIFLKTLGLKNQQLYRFAVGVLEDNKQIYRDDDNVYFKAFYEAEKNVAGILNTINNEFADGKYDEKVVQEELHNFPFTLNIEQIDAIRSCLKHQFNVITSKAGCVSGDTEYFNGKCWVPIKDYQEGDKVLQYNPQTSKAELVTPNSFIVEPANLFHVYNQTKQINQVISDNHNVAYLDYKGSIKIKTLNDIIETKGNYGILNHFTIDESNTVNISPEQLRLWVAISADGSKSRQKWRIRVLKSYKIERLRKLISDVGLELDERVYQDGSHNFYVPLKYGTKLFPKEWYLLPNHLKQVFQEEIFLWDGSKESRIYRTTEKNNADIAQFILSQMGYRCSIHIDDRTGRVNNGYITKNKCYHIRVTRNKRTTLYISTGAKTHASKIKIDKYEAENQYCFNVPSHLLVLRYQNNIFITGNCGKSTISKAILRIINRSGENTVLIAPTAKAAKRLEECTGYGASTIHRFLKIKDASLESETKVTVPRSTTILIDEASMIDVRLFEKVLEAIQTDTRVILVGDTHQLPSVQAGNVLEDIINSKKFNVCYLTNITRQSDNSNIIKYSNQVNEGIFLPTELQEHDFVCNTIQSFQREQMLTTLAFSYRKNVERYGLLNVQVICAYKQGVLGVNNLNKVLKSVVNENEAKEDDIFPFQVGDKVRHTINDYKLGVFNGETGVVREFVPAEAPENDEGEDLMLVDFGDKYVYYNKANSYELTLSYANTVHSSQGSEYDIVYVVLDNEISNILLVRKIVYTAITRAKKKCYIINVMPCVNTAISNDHYKVRLTKLTDFILEGVKTDIADEEFDVDEFDEIPF